ncbi:MAG TPA: elongation factor P [Bacteroidetes bacterium]|nr:elongation factor P [Bacteroidota bacterium]
MANTSDFRNGLVIKYNHDLFQIIEFQHVKPGKGAAFVRTKLKSITTGRVLDNTFPSGSKVETARVETRKHQFLYKDDFGYHFMNAKTYEQVSLEEKMINAPGLLLEGNDVDVLFNADNETPLNCELPSFINLEINYTEPGVKGDTATNTLKPATLETGSNIQVPLFINNGDKIKIDTRTNSYVERVKH